MNSPRPWRRTVAVALLAQLLLLTQALTQNTTAAKRPDQAATEFYRWYLAELAQHHNPLSDRDKPLKVYVAAPLLREIDRRMHSAEGLDADYFIQAQDYLDDWLKNVSASETTTRARSAKTVVTLGEERDSRYRLAVDLVDEGGAWKIRRVRRRRP